MSLEGDLRLIEDNAISLTSKPDPGVSSTHFILDYKKMYNYFICTYIVKIKTYILYIIYMY